MKINKKGKYTELVNGKEIIENIMLTQEFISDEEHLTKPTICVLRNTNLKTGTGFVPDSGDNNCDTVLLTGEQTLVLQGRSFPHRNYINKMLRKEGKCNYIASQYCPQAWQRGLHRGHKAAVQVKKFTILRTKDSALQNEDDWPEFDIVSDNFHGWAPLSAGCVTVEGDMKTRSGDWEVAYEYLYQSNKEERYFDALILENEDLLMNEPRYRLGSKGGMVEYLQSLLSTRFEMKVDGFFGPYTHEVVRQFQLDFQIDVTGIVDRETFEKIDEVC